MADGDIDDRVRTEMWVSALVLVVGWCAWVLTSERSKLGLLAIAAAYLVT